jgi:hypothetical protein
MDKEKKENFPEIITLCGSTKFKTQFLEATKKLSLEGKIVISVGLFGHADKEEMAWKNKEMLDNLHLRKIDLAESIMVIDVDNYIGESTRREINYTQLNNKRIYYYSEYFKK